MTTLQEVYPRTQDLPLALRCMIDRGELQWHGRTIERGPCDCHSFGLAHPSYDHLVVIDAMHDTTACIPGCPREATCLAVSPDGEGIECLRPPLHLGAHEHAWATGEIMTWREIELGGFGPRTTVPIVHSGRLPEVDWADPLTERALDGDR